MVRLLLIGIFVFGTASFFAQPGFPDIHALLDQYKNDFGLSPEDISEYAISDSYTTAHLHITHVYLEQKYRDIRVFNGILNLNLMEDRMVSFGNRWITDLHKKAPSPLPGITAQTAVELSANNLGYNFKDADEISREQNKFGQYTKVKFN